MPPSRLIGDDTPAWSRLEADIHLAAGRWREAIDGYTDLLVGPDRHRPARGAPARPRRGVPPASMTRLAAVADAAEAMRIFTPLGRRVGRGTGHVLACLRAVQAGQLGRGAVAAAGRAGRVRGGLAVEPDFNIRLLLALSTVEAHDGEHARALAYLQEVRASRPSSTTGGAPRTCTTSLRLSRDGRYEAAIRTGLQSLALYRASGAEFEMAALENNLALAFLANGNTGKATELLASAQDRFERLHDERWLAHVLDTAAQIALAGGDPRGAQRLTGEALEVAEQTQNVRALVSALITQARAQVALGATEEADRTFERAADLAREARLRGVLRELLGQWAETLAKAGQHERAYALTREALTAS